MLNLANRIAEKAVIRKAVKGITRKKNSSPMKAG